MLRCETYLGGAGDRHVRFLFTHDGRTHKTHLCAPLTLETIEYLLRAMERKVGKSLSSTPFTVYVIA